MSSFVSAHENIAAIRSGETTAAELATEALERIQSIDQSGYELNSVLAVSKSALSDALTINQDLPLAGLPIFIKDNIQAAGLPGTAGSKALKSHPVKKDAELVTRLRAAGANIIGATNLSEWANIRSTTSTSGWSAVGGLTANPWIHKHSAGGSSSGSGSSVAAGLVTLAVGTETDGSIICPASLNGCVGIKPTVGNVSRVGVVPISDAQDSPGPMARSVADAALLLEVLSGIPNLVAAANSTEPLRIGIVKSWLSGDAGTDALFEAAVNALSKTDAKLVEIKVSAPAESISNDEYECLLHELVDDLAAYMADRTDGAIVSLAEVVKFNLLNSDTELKYFGQELFDAALELGGRARAYNRKRSRNLEWAKKTLDTALIDVDVLIGASYRPAWESTLGKGDDYGKNSWITMAPAIAGYPIGTVPMGITESLPVGLGVVARANDESKLVAAMAKIESAIGLGVLKPTFIK
ncbi:GatA Asp-tRNAAsn/Glu-tRNAGln amidotransferase A subunit and related amidases [Candidatus Nanopelagicaceae bacterium]